ncbi:MAG: hypothetical protein QM755_14820 [Luteolibacter sp.]
MNDPTQKELRSLSMENRAHGFFRFILWFLPTVFAAASGLTMARIHGVNELLLKTVWVISNLAFTAGAGWFNAILSIEIRLAPEEQRHRRIISRVISFTLLQIMVVPVLICAFSLMVLLSVQLIR